MDYNKALKEDIVPYIVDNILDKVATNSDDWGIHIRNHKLTLATKDFDYYKNEGLSCLAELVVNYTVYPRKGGPARDESISLFIPQMVKSIFVIDGKARTHESYFDKCDDFNIGPGVISFNGATYREKDKILHLYVRGVGTKSIPYDEIENPTSYGEEFKDKRFLTPRQQKKIEIMYNFKPGNELKKETIDKILDGYELTKRDHVVTRQLITVDRAFYQHLVRCTNKVLRTLKGQFYKNNSIYPATLQNTIYNFFKGRSESLNPVHFPDNFNELSYLISDRKVILETGNAGTPKVGLTSYNPSFFDTVDSSVTPDNKHINRVNEITQAVVVNADGSVNMRVLDRNFKETQIEQLDYMLSKVLHYSQVDYWQKTILPKSVDGYKVKYKGKLIRSHGFDYIDLHPDERLATTSRMIPMMSAVDSVRVSMSSKMMKQAISTVSSEAPLIASGHENLKDSTPLGAVWKGTEGGEVVSSDSFKGEVVVKDSKNKLHKFTVPTPISSQKRTAIQFQTAPVGTKLKNGELVYHSVNLNSNGQLSVGSNLLTAFMYWRGMDFEDSIAISESCARKLTHIGEHTMYYDIKDGDRIAHIVEPGQIVSSLKRDKILTIEKDLVLTRAEEGLKTLVTTHQRQTKLLGLKVPNNIPEAMIVDIKYIEVTRNPELKRTLDSVANKRYTNTTNSEGKKFLSRYSKFPMRELTIPRELPEGETKDVMYRVYFKLMIANVTKEGDKLTNRFGSKGVISAVVPDKEFVRTMDGKVIDIVMNPSSVIARKNLPQSSEANLSKVTNAVWDRIEKMTINTATWPQVQEFLRRYHFDYLAAYTMSDFKRYHKSLENSINKYQVRTGAFTPYSPARIVEILKELKVEDKEMVIDGKTGRVIKTPIMVGYTNIMKLHHMSEFQDKVTVEDKKDRNPFALGLGEIKSEGQKIGEMESVALIAHGAEGYLKSVRGNEKSDWFLVNMLQSSQVITDGEGTPMMSEFRHKATPQTNRFK